MFVHRIYTVSFTSVLLLSSNTSSPSFFFCHAALHRTVNTAPSSSVTMAANDAWTWYKSMLASQPLLTKSLTSGFLMSLSDVLCQELVTVRSSSVSTTLPDKKKRGQDTESSSSSSTMTPTNLDWHRTLQVAITGMIWSGPITHFWYGLLEKIYAFLAQLLDIQHPAMGLCVKLLLDAALFSPTVVMGYFIVRSLLEGGGGGDSDWVSRAKNKLQTKFKPTLVGAWKFWPAVNSVNFYFVPLQFRVLYMNILSLFWSGYLTYVNSSARIVSRKKQR